MRPLDVSDLSPVSAVQVINIDGEPSTQALSVFDRSVMRREFGALIMSTKSSQETVCADPCKRCCEEMLRMSAFYRYHPKSFGEDILYIDPLILLQELYVILRETTHRTYRGPCVGQSTERAPGALIFPRRRSCTGSVDRESTS